MIWESRFWKDDLLRKADALAKRQTQRRWPEASFGRLEQDIMVAAYSMRKLVEAAKLSDAVLDTVMPVRAFPPTGKLVTLLNWHKIDQLYDLSKGDQIELSLKALCNQIIHSYVFMPDVAESGLEGFLVASDWERRSRLFDVAIGDFIQLLRRVGTDYPAEGRWTWNEERKDYDVTAGTKP